MAKRVSGSAGGGERKAYWRAVIERWRASGQTQAAFCRQRRIRVGSFVWWKHRLARGEAGGEPGAVTSRAKEAGFLEVSLSGPSSGEVEPFGYEVELRGGRRVRLTEAFTAAGLSRLISALEGSC